MRALAVVGLIAGLLCPAAHGADVPVAGRRLVLTGTGPGYRDGTLIFDVRSPEVTKGPAPASPNDAPGLDATVEVYYGDTPGAFAGRWVLPAPWAANRSTGARFANRGAPAGPSSVRTAVIREGKLALVIASGLGDGGSRASLAAGPPSAAGGVTAILTVHNAIDGSTRRYCTRFATGDGSRLQFTSRGGRRRLVARHGVPTSCDLHLALAQGPECEGLNQAACLLPYPSSRFEVPAPTATGFRLNIPASGFPHVNGDPVDPAPINVLDGFSPGSQILMHFPQGVDPEKSNAARLLPPLCCGQPAGPPWVDTRTYTDRSRDPDSPTILLDADTGERLLHFVEPDARATTVARQIFFLRPARILTPGHRYVVGMRNLVAPDGSPVVAEPAFAALRESIATDAPAIEARRADMEAHVFAPLATAGVERHALVLAFDFTVASDQQETSTMLAMRDQAYTWLDGIAATPNLQSFSVSSVEEHDCSVPGTFIWRYVRGTYESPLFLTGDLNDTSAPFQNVDASGTPVQNGVTHPNFTVTIACSALDPLATTRQFLFGHGLFQTGDFMTSVIPAIVNTTVPWTGIAAATDWRGLSGPDLAWVANQVIGTHTSQLNNFPAFPARLRQGMLNTLVLGRMMKLGLFNRHPAFQRADGSGVVPGPTQDLYYYGVSLGGIMGTYLAGLTPDIERFVLDVPGVNFSCMLQRAQPFVAFDVLLDAIGVADSLDATLGEQLTHELWAMAEPVSVVHHVTQDPLPGSGPPKKVLYDAAWLDKQVSNQCTEIAARTLGLPNLEGSIQQGLVDIPDVAGPVDSAYLTWHLGELDILNPAQAAHIPPLANLFPDGVCDPHPRRPTVPAGIRQIDAFLRPDGQIMNFCDGLCDGSVPAERPAGPCTP